MNLMKTWYNKLSIESDSFIKLDVLCRVFFNRVSLKRFCESKDWRAEIFREVEECENDGEEEEEQEEPNVAALVYVTETPEEIKPMP